MTRKPYIIKENEIESLMTGLISHGVEKTYEQMKIRATMAMEKSTDIDEMFLDMYESMIVKARSLDEDSEEAKPIRLGYYTIASMLRRLSHEIHRAYLRTNKEKDNSRFLHLASDNPTAPTPSW